MATKEEYQTKMDAQLKEISNKLADLMAKTDMAAAGVKEQYKEHIQAVKAKLQETQGRLGQVKGSSGEAWEAMKDGTEKAWVELRGAMDKAIAKFK